MTPVTAAELAALPGWGIAAGLLVMLAVALRLLHAPRWPRRCPRCGARRTGRVGRRGTYAHVGYACYSYVAIDGEFHRSSTCTYRAAQQHARSPRG